MRFRSGTARQSLDSTTAALSRKGRWLAAIVLLSFAAGCGGSEDNDDGWFTLVLVPEAGTDPFADPDAEYLSLSIDNSVGDSLADEEFLIASGDFTLDNSPTGRGLYFVVAITDGTAARTVIAAGDSGPHALLEGEHTTVTVVLETP